MDLHKIISARHRGERAFVSTCRTTTANETITLPTPTDYPVDWGDGTSTTNANSHVYSLAGDYEIKIRGDIADFRFSNTGDKDKILEVSNFGGLYLVNACFYGCENLSFIDDNFKVLGTSLGSTFNGCSKLNSPMDSLDTTGVSVMTTTFRDASVFNQDLNHLDLSSVTNLDGCFYQATAFDGDISSWDVSNVESIATIMFSASSFNGDISSWNTENLVNCSTAFQDAILFNSDIGGWDVSNVTQMQNMLRNTSFNYPLNLWDVSNVTNMFALFGLTVSFNQDVSSWDFTSVTNMNAFMAGKGSEYDTTYMDNLYIKLDQDLNFSNMININLGFGTINYTSNGASARTSLINKGFIITSGGQV